MLIIRKEQMDAFEKNSLDQFIQEMMRHLNLRFPQKTPSEFEPEFYRQIQGAMDQARKYDVQDKNDVKRFLEYAVQYDFTFANSQETNWAHEILARPQGSGIEKMDMIDNHYLFNIELGKI